MATQIMTKEQPSRYEAIANVFNTISELYFLNYKGANLIDEAKAHGCRIIIDDDRETREYIKKPRNPLVEMFRQKSLTEQINYALLTDHTYIMRYMARYDNLFETDFGEHDLMNEDLRTFMEITRIEVQYKDYGRMQLVLHFDIDNETSYGLINVFTLESDLATPGLPDNEEDL